MTFILRWPAILVLLALVLLCAAGALAAAGILSGYQVPIAQVQAVQAEVATTEAADAGWLDVGLLAAAAVFFLISAIRLIRKTQGFWTWLLGFAAYAGLWAYRQGPSLVDSIKSIDWSMYAQPQSLLTDPGSIQTQVAVLGIILICGLFVFIADAADRAYWDRHEAGA